MMLIHKNISVDYQTITVSIKKNLIKYLELTEVPYKLDKNSSIMKTKEATNNWLKALLALVLVGVMVTAFIYNLG